MVSLGTLAIGILGSKYLKNLRVFRPESVNGIAKPPTITVLQLVEGVYQGQLFRAGERIISPTFPELQLTAAQALAGRL